MANDQAADREADASSREGVEVLFEEEFDHGCKMCCEATSSGRRVHCYVDTRDSKFARAVQGVNVLANERVLQVSWSSQNATYMKNFHLPFSINCPAKGDVLKQGKAHVDPKCPEGPQALMDAKGVLRITCYEQVS